MERKEAIRSAYRLTGGNKPFWKKLMYRAFSTAQKHCDTWHDYEMDVAPYENTCRFLFLHCRLCLPPADLSKFFANRPDLSMFLPIYIFFRKIPLLP